MDLSRDILVVRHVGYITLNAQCARSDLGDCLLDGTLSPAGDYDLAPSDAKAFAADSPIPLFPPVINAVFPESIPI
jgi:hypothetical protein